MKVYFYFLTYERVIKIYQPKNHFPKSDKMGELLSWTKDISASSGTFLLFYY